jgi:hypothetical protein
VAGQGVAAYRQKGNSFTDVTCRNDAKQIPEDLDGVINHLYPFRLVFAPLRRTKMAMDRPRAANVVIEVSAGPGHFVDRGATLATVRSRDSLHPEFSRNVWGASFTSPRSGC